jgi:amino acid adenylation domain-containing protein
MNATYTADTAHTAMAQDVSPVDYDPFAGESLARVVPTTEAQREMWLADQLGREASLAYNESASLHIRGPLDLVLLQRALHVLPVRHEMLRTTVSGDGMNLLIGNDAALPLRIVDLRLLAADMQAQAVERLRMEAVETPFDLVGGPLFKATAAVLDAQHCELILTGHHIVCDGWSFGVLASELMKIYAGLVTGAPAKLAPADSFADYALAQLDPVQLSTAEADCRYWVSIYDASVPLLDLPADRPRPSRRTFNSRREDAPIEASLVKRLRQYSAREGATLFATMFGMFSGLMAKLSGSHEVVIGVPIAGQAAAGRQALVGHCVNVLPVRVATDHLAASTDLIRNAGSRVLDAVEHQSCTFGTLLKKLQIERDPGRMPLISVLFNLDMAILGADLSVAGLQVEFCANPRRYENFELFLNASQGDAGIRLELQYNADLFDSATVQRWMALYRTALERLVNTDALSVAAAFEPTEAEFAQLTAWNRTMRAYPAQATIQELIERQAQAAPQRIAVSAGGERLSYAALERRARQVAQLLRGRGVGRGSRVGLCVERGAGMLVALLGILKSGAAYVPLDPAFPRERLQFMATDAGLAALVSQAALAGVLPWPRDRTILLDADAAVLEAQPAQAVAALPADVAGADDVAYLIYTSGSTGTPKGVQVPHRAVVNFLSSMRHEPGIGADDRLLAVTTLSFDIAVLELLLPLTVGAEVVLASREQVRDPHALAALLASSRASLMQATPGTWRMLLDAGWQAPAGFKALIGGEALSPDLAARLLPATTELCARLLPATTELWNMYGPTETTVWSTCWRVSAIEAGISIGRPIANTTVWILDEQRRPCPIGTPGEIWIGGDGVTRGYLQRPELTAERFIADPFSTVPGARLYGTGDRGRWRADGMLEHLGRTDFQLKVRGYRIEPGEIEAALDSHPGVAHSVVVAREDVPGDVRLLAYLVPRAAATDEAQLRDHLRARLPAYMLPQHFIALPHLPLLPNGKINRGALPKPDPACAVPAERTQAELPTTDTEKRLAAVWEELLKLPGIRVDDNFFDLGGHSLLAMQSILVMETRTGKRLNPRRMIFETLRQVARAYDELQVEAPKAGMLNRMFSGLLKRHST